MVSCDTMFSDLPQDVKQKIIKIRSMASAPVSHSAAVPLKKFEAIAVPSSKPLYQDFLKLCEATKNLRQTNVEDALRTQVEEFRRFVEAYKMAAGETDFVGELDRTIQALETRCSKLRKESLLK